MEAIAQVLPLLGCHAPVAVPEQLAAIFVHLPVALVIFTDALLLFGREIAKRLGAFSNGISPAVIELAPLPEAALGLLALLVRHTGPALSAARQPCLALFGEAVPGIRELAQHLTLSLAQRFPADAVIVGNGGAEHQQADHCGYPISSHL